VSMLPLSATNLTWPTLTELRDTQPLWFYAALFNFALMAFCVIAGVFDDRTFNGISVWSKPIKFGLSVGVYFITLIWFATFLSKETLTSAAGKCLVAIPLIAGIVETIYIAVMAGLGLASHYNYSSNFTSIMYALMGLGAWSMVLVLPWMGYLIAKQNALTNPLIFAIVAGLCVTLILGGGFGSHLATSSSHWVNATPTDADGLWLFNWARDGGDLRVAHFFGMHAMHAFPLVALLLPKTWAEKLKLRVLVIFITGYVALSAGTFWQSINGQPFWAG
jgi:hypothetical protein